MHQIECGSWMQRSSCYPLAFGELFIATRCQWSRTRAWYPHSARVLHLQHNGGNGFLVSLDDVRKTA